MWFSYLTSLHVCCITCRLLTLWKKGVLRLGFQFNFWIVIIICNSLYFYTHSNVIRQVARVAKDVTHHIYNHTLVQPITIQLQFHYNNPFSTTMQFPYNHNHNVMLTSLFIHSSKSNTCHYEGFLMNCFLTIDIHHPLWMFILDGLWLWHVAY